jgi:thiamine pyrophosphokinase
MTEFDAAILANGTFPTAAEPLRLLRQAPFVVCCDGAARRWPQADAIVGDGDSVPENLRSRLIQIDEQYDNDLTKATRYCLARGMRRIVYLGATGLREDHTLGNIALLVRYVTELGVDALMATDNGWFVVRQGTAVFDAAPGQQVSIFNFGCRQLRSTGLKWETYPFSQFWQGTLNEALADTFRIDADGPYLVYRTYAHHH